MPVALENFSPARAGRDFLYVAGGLPLGIAWFTFLVTALSVGLSLAIVTIGIPVLAVTLLIWRWGANTERQRAALVLGRADPAAGAARCPARSAGSTAGPRACATAGPGAGWATCCCSARSGSSAA